MSTGMYSTSGVLVLHGIISEARLPNLQGTNGYKNSRRICRSWAS